MEQSRGLMNKNRITRPTRPDEQAGCCEVHGHEGSGGKSGRRAVKAIGLTSGGLRPCPGDGTAGRRKAPGSQRRSQQRA